MQKKIRPDPLIPDHEVLRKIGGGAYGEVWLARGVTGAMRAVKFVYREDFSDERTFEREFEGILRFEPISRDHRGFVNILHVGRSDGQTEFYYYVMELGDDAHDEGEINPVEYEPRTLRTDMLRANGKPLATYFCIETGRRLAEALSELHERGLTHRDVKPSNVIFVDGKAKLADIGLVAATDQRTFVGTEGFVPPEGPGSEQADIYSLGKVLYEMATGMDRLQFPELPNESPGDDYRKKWIRLNRLICDICDPRIAKRKIKTGKELAETLGHLQRGRNGPKKIPAFVKVVMLLLMLVGAFASQIWIEKTWGTHIVEGKREPLPSRQIMVKILIEPFGAEIYNSEGERISQTTPATLYGVELGSELNLVLKFPQYSDLPLNEVVVDQGDQVMIINRTMSLFSPPKNGETWTDVLEHKYYPLPRFPGQHKSADHVSEADWKLYVAETERKLKPIVFKHGGRRIVAVPEEWTVDYTTWLEARCLKEGYFVEYSEDKPESNRQLVPSYDLNFDQAKLPAEAKKGGKVLRPFHCLVRPIPYGSLSIGSKPSGAKIYLNGIPMGFTPLYEENIAPGDIKVTLILGGKETVNDTIYLPDRGSKIRNYDLVPNKSLVPGESWTNSIDMELEPLRETLSVSKWETRSGDYRKFLEDRKYLKEKKIKQGAVILSENPLIPVVGVTREDCENFCKWLTSRERDNPIPEFNRITEDYSYRLPTDQEWSQMVGLIEVGDSPAERERDVSNASQFPWGESFPPLDNTGNYADTSAVEIFENDQLIAGYFDGFSKLAPVGQFKPNIMGLYDLGGNVHEWVSDSYWKEPLGDFTWGVVRGGGWNSSSEENLESRFRLPVSMESRKDTFGFRVVLARNVEEEEPETIEAEEGDSGDSN